MSSSDPLVVPVEVAAMVLNDPAANLLRAEMNYAQLANMAKQAKAVLQVEELAAVADRGYFNSPEILDCATAGITVRHTCHDSLVHGFLSLAGIVHAAKSATDQICAEIVELLA